MASTRGREDDRRGGRGGRDDRRPAGRDDRRSTGRDREERSTRGRDDDDRRRPAGRDDRGGRDRDRGGRGKDRGAAKAGTWLRDYDGDAPSYDEVKKLSESRSGRFDSPFKPDYPTFRPASGTNAVRILPKTWEGEGRHWAYQVWMHRYVGTRNGSYVCPKLQFNKPDCPICDAEAEARKDGDEEEARDLAAKSQWICWVLDREGDDPDKPLIWQMSEMQGKDIVNLTWDEKRGDTQHISGPNKGRDLLFIRSQRGNDVKTTRYSSFKFDMESSPIHEDPDTMDDIIDYIEKNPIPETLMERTLEYLEGVMSGTSQETDEDLDDKGGDEDRGGGDDDDADDEDRDTRRGRDREERGGRSRGTVRGRGEKEDPPLEDEDEEDPPSDDEDAGSAEETSQDHDHEAEEARQSARSARGGRRGNGREAEPEPPEDRRTTRGSGRKPAPAPRGGREERAAGRRSARGR